MPQTPSHTSLAQPFLGPRVANDDELSSPHSQSRAPGGAMEAYELHAEGKGWAGLCAWMGGGRAQAQRRTQHAVKCSQRTLPLAQDRYTHTHIDIHTRIYHTYT